MEAKTVQLIQLDKVKQALALATEVTEVKQIRDRAEALRQYIRQQGASSEGQNYCAEIKLRAERKAGEMLGEQIPHEGGRPKLLDGQTVFLKSLGISRFQSHYWQLEASISEEIFEQHIAWIKAKAKELTSIGVIRIAKEIKRQQSLEENRRLVEQTPPLPDSKFKTIMIDPPWDWGDEGDYSQFGRARPTFETRPFNEFLELPIPDLSEEDSHLYLWVTNRSLPKAFKLIEHWGFRYITLLTWCKPSFGMGNYFRGQTEHILFAVKGSCPLLRHDIGTWFLAERGNNHSSKPEKIFEIIESCSPRPWLYIYARDERDNWSCWGAEVGTR